MDNITFKATISRNIIFKTLLLKGEAGNNIVSIEKTSSQGLVDTYTITLTDGTTTTFQVTNGSGIQSIVKTSTSGLIDTYTITYQNGETSFFTVTNGRSIVDIEKTSTVGVLDTYTISYNDNTTSTFTIKNGMDYTVPTNGVIMYDGNDTPEGYEDYAGTFGSGHTLENQSGTDMPQQPNMQFVDAQLANDATNERTTVEVVKAIPAQQLQSAPDGLYLIPDDGSGAVLDAEDVSYSNGVNVKQKIDSVANINDASIIQNLSIREVPSLAEGTIIGGGTYYYKIGSIVFFQFNIGGLTPNSIRTIYTMPQGFRPATKIGIECASSNDASKKGRFEMYSDGTVRAFSEDGYVEGLLVYGAFN